MGHAFQGLMLGWRRKIYKLVFRTKVRLGLGAIRMGGHSLGSGDQWFPTRLCPLVAE